MADMQHETNETTDDRRAKARKTPEPVQTPKTAEPARANGRGRQPIPIAKICFSVHRAHTSPGLQQQTTITTREHERCHGHDLAYLPWVRAFRVSFWATADGPPTVCYVPEGEVVRWVPADGVEID